MQWEGGLYEYNIYLLRLILDPAKVNPIGSPLSPQNANEQMSTRLNLKYKLEHPNCGYDNKTSKTFPK